MVINDLFAAVLTVDIHLYHTGIEWPWAVEGTHGDDVFDVGRLQLGQVFFHTHTL